jgi:hypothetical protein
MIKILIEVDPLGTYPDSEEAELQTAFAAFLLDYGYEDFWVDDKHFVNEKIK